VLFFLNVIQTPLRYI